MPSPRVASPSNIVRGPQPGKARCPGASMTLLLFLTFPLISGVEAWPLLVPGWCAGHRPRHSSAAGGAQPRAGSGAPPSPHLGEGSPVERSPLTVGSEPRSLSKLVRSCRSVPPESTQSLRTATTQVAGADVGLAARRSILAPYG
ncbi:hypothetical protein NDU88_008024 [Pleurodeles waltl]|uniref:Uncharacterized protein n=1 Tax=Pleurodeles waltl TaxID=8319 RepID=A0AAV7PV37_PLEWA|nr:hypothetical protein NDU88_008024 [Pleurodeles waltl]